MSQFVKAKTQFDGITSEEWVSYIKLNSSQSLVLEVLTTAQVGTNLNFTVSCLIKPDPIMTQANSGGLQYLFGFP